MRRLLTSAVAVLALATPIFGQSAGLELLPVSKATLKKAQQAEKKKGSEAVKKLQRKWIVETVQRDGKPNAAQIGQKLGDIITIKQGAAGIGFG